MHKSTITCKKPLARTFPKYLCIAFMTGVGNYTGNFYTLVGFNMTYKLGFVYEVYES